MRETSSEYLLTDKDGTALRLWRGGDQSLADRDRQNAQALLAGIFDGNGLSDEHPATYRTLVYRGDQLVASAAGLRRSWLINGVEQTGILVGYVCSADGYRGCGYAGIALRALMDWLEEVDDLPGILHCAWNLLPFYGKFGWQKSAAAALYDEDDGSQRLDPDPVMTWDPRGVLTDVNFADPFPIGFDW